MKKSERAKNRKHYLRKQIFELMEFKNMTANELSMRSGVNLSTIYKIKNGSSSEPSTYEAIFNALGWTLTARPLKHNTGKQTNLDFEK